MKVSLAVRLLTSTAFDQLVVAAVPFRRSFSVVAVLFFVPLLPRTSPSLSPSLLSLLQPNTMHPTPLVSCRCIVPSLPRRRRRPRFSAVLVVALAHIVAALVADAALVVG